MIYIIGHRFTVCSGGQSSIRQSKSVTKRLNHQLGLQHANHQTSSDIDGLQIGRTYEILNVRKVDNEIEYIFRSGTHKTVKRFQSFEEGDEYIARVSGSTDKLRNIRQSIVNASLTSE